LNSYIVRDANRQNRVVYSDYLARAGVTNPI